MITSIYGEENRVKDKRKGSSSIKDMKIGVKFNTCNEIKLVNRYSRKNSKGLVWCSKRSALFFEFLRLNLGARIQENLFS
jgi:hypothetical protein